MIEVARSELLRGAWVMPPDVKVLRTEDLAERVRVEIDARPGEFAVTRPGFRTFSRIVDRDTIALLDEFRTPKPLAEGIVRFARGRGLDPETVLREAFPVLQTFTASLLLVPGNSEFASGVEASFVAGQAVHGFEIKRLIQALQDTEVYLAETAERGTVALKVARPAAVDATRFMLEREAAILERLAGEDAPRLVSADLRSTQPFLATAWIAGVPISARATELRVGKPVGWRARLHRLCADLIAAYARLHVRHVVHGDAHPRNVLVDAHDRIRIIDFGLARVLEPGSPYDHAQRAGFSWNTEPEAAAALVALGAARAASPEGEQFSVASIIYTLVCGEHYSGSAPTRDELLRRALEVPPLPFARHGFESWPEVECVLARALAKDPADRFTDLNEFAAAFRAAQPGRAASVPDAVRANRKLLDDVLHRIAVPASSIEAMYPRAPRVSTHYGAAGLAYFLYRVSLMRRSPRLLALADHWSRLALANSDGEHAFESDDIGATPENPAQSLYYRRPGVHLVHGLISHARGDRREFQEHSTLYAGALEQSGPSELLLGNSGLLLGAALLLEAADAIPRDAGDRLRAAAAQAADRIWQSAFPEDNDPDIPHHLGMAHGDGGVLYAQMRVRSALGLAMPEGLADKLDALARLAEPSGRGCAWPGTLESGPTGPVTPDHAPGWCAGSAGHVHLWLLADRVTGNPSCLPLAEKAAWHCWEHPDRSGHLCCGLAGRAYALLAFYQHSGDTRWLERAEILIDQSHAWVEEELRSGDRPLSLYWGALGPLIAEQELERPELAAMPLFASEGWPPLA